MTKKFFVTSLLLLIIAPLAQADFDSAKWQFKKEIIAPAGTAGAQAFGELALDGEILSGARADFADIRIMENGEREAPYVLATEAPQTAVETYPVRMIDKGIVEGNYTQFTADVGEGGALHNKIEIVVDTLKSKNFRREAQVEGSRDGTAWITLAKKSIYDYTVEFTARDTAIGYQESAYRYLRVTIFDRGESPLAITGARVTRETVATGKEVAYEGMIKERAEKKSERAEQITFDLGTRGLPTNRLSVNTADVNFNRGAALEGTNDGTVWATLIYRDVLFSYDTPKFVGSKLELRYPETNYRYLRLTIFNKDDAPLAVKGATFYGLVRKAVFAYSPASSYKIHYGNPAARRPEYDLANYLAYFDQGSRIVLSLGKQVENNDYAPDVPFVPFSERYKWFLNFTLIVAVAVVGGILVRVMRRK